MEDLFKEFFKQNPHKILGTIKETTDKYGNPDIMIIGTDEDLDNIDVSPSLMPEKNKDVSDIDPIDINTDDANNNLAKAISESDVSKKQDKQDRKRKQKTKKKFSIVREADDTQELYTGDEAFKVLNPHGFDDQYMSVWVWYCESVGRPLHPYFNKFKVSPTNDWFKINLKNGNLCYDNESKNYLPSCIYYSGNIYEKIMYAESSATNDIYTEEQKQLQIKTLKNILPKPLLLTGEKDERLVIDVLSKFADTFEIESQDGENQSIREGFKDYLRSLDANDLKYGISGSRISSYYIDGDRMPNYMDKIEKADLKRKAGLECSHQMSIYLSEVIPPKSRTSIEIFWNREHNGFVDVNYNKIPLYFEFSKKFKKADLEVRPAQREGVAFNTINGTGIIAYDVGVGKGHLMTSKILTPNGYVQMKDIKYGDYVVGKDGNATEVVGIYPLGKVQCYRVKFSDGSYADVSDEHLWNVQTINYRSKYKDKWDTVRTIDIKDSLYNYRGDYNYSIPMVSPVNFDYVPIPIPAYLLGALIGDGSLSRGSICFSNTEKDIQQKISKMLPVGVSMKTVVENKDFRLSVDCSNDGNPLVDDLRLIGLYGKKSNEKFIPDVYKFNTAEVRLEMLRGLIDTDGYLRSNKKGCLIQYTTVSERLSEDVKFLVQSFGGTVCVSTKTPTFTYKGERKQGQLAYTLTIRLPKGIIPVSSEKHLSKFDQKTKYQPIRFIESIEDIGFHDAQCIKVDAKDSLYVCEEFIVTHNTATAILNVANAMQNGLCKRPLLVVPKATYEKWISEFRGIYNDDDEFVGAGILPQYPIYDLFNLSPKHQTELFTSDGHFKGIPEGSISIVTYQGLANIGFSQNVMQNFKDRLVEILNQGFSDASERAKALSDEKVMKLLGVGVEGTTLNIDEAQFDYMVIDEAHNMNKIFTGVKGEAKEGGGKRESTHYKVSGQYSARGVKSFFLSNYIQDNTRFGNICLLTATPFTNNPLEVFNILSLTNYNRLKSFGINNMVSFFDNYINQTSEKVVTSKGTIEERQVIKGWTNKVSLQKVLFSYMNYKSGEDANIKRPAKWTLPKLSENIDGVNIPLAFEDQITTYLKPTIEQKIAQKEISEWLIEQMKDSELMAKAPHLVADMKAKKNCISHYVYEDYPTRMLTPQDFVNSSPKLKYTVDCIKSIIDWHKKDGSELSNQVIYINGAINYLPLLKRYFIEELGYKTGIYEYGRGKFFDEVEILTGGGGSSDDEGDEDLKKLKRTDDEKEDIKNLFNSGKIKIIIGTSTIREGIDLQNRSSALFNLWVDWNPTDYKQLEGRIWRFGNEFKNVRIVTPLIVGSSDAFTYQKLEEKTARINDIFDRNDRSNILDVGEEDREAIKWALIDDLKQVVIAKIKDEVDILNKQAEAIKDDIEALSSIGKTMNDLNSNIKELKDVVNKWWKYAIRAKSKYTPEEIASFDDLAKMRFVNSLKSQIEEMAIADGNWNGSYWGDKREIESTAWKIKDIKKDSEQLERLEKRIQDKFNVSIYEDTESIRTQLQSELEAINDKKDVLRSEEYINEETAKMEAEREKFNGGIEDFDQTVSKFTKLNYLLGEKEPIQNVPVKTKEKVVEKLPEAIEQKKVVSVELPDEITIEPEKTTTEEVVVEKKSDSSKQKIEQAIDDFEFLLEMAETDSEKEKIQTAIEDFKFLLEMDVFAVGGEVEYLS